MFKKIIKYLFFIFIMLIINIPQSFAAEEERGNWFYYPNGYNYLDPDNFSGGPVSANFSMSSIHMFRIKPKTIYYFWPESSEMQISTFEFYFFDNQYQPLNIIPEYDYNYDMGKIISITFESPNMAHFIAIDLELFCLHPQEFAGRDIDDYYVFQEKNSPQVGSKRYQGPNCLYPLVDIDEISYYINYANIVDVEELKGSLYAIDDVDGNVSDLIYIVTDDYTPNIGKLGSYPVKFQVSDSSGNTAILTIIIIAEDLTKPEIFGPEVVEIEPDELLTGEYFLDFLSAEDDYDGNVTSEIAIIANNYEGNYNEKGLYQIVFQVFDSSGNSCEYILYVDVQDRTPPVISGPGLITKGNNQNLKISEIILGYSAYDSYEGDLTDMIEIGEDNYSLKANQVGVHSIVFFVEDGAGNRGEYQVAVEVVDMTPPIFFLDESKMTISIENNGIALRDIISLYLANSNNHGVIEIIIDEYSGNEKTPGQYGVVVRTKNEYYKLEVVVNEVEVVSPIKVSFFKRIGNFFKSIWKAIKNFFI